MGNYQAGKGRRHIVIYYEGQRHEWKIQATKAEGDLFESERRTELQRASEDPNHRTAVSFSALFQEYSEHAIQHLKASTWNDVRVYQVATLSEFFGRHNVDRLCTPLVDSYKKLRSKAVGVTTINNELRILRAATNWGRDAGYPIPVTKWKPLPQRGDDFVKVWTEDELQKIFRAARKLSPDMVPLCVFLLNTGLRSGEGLAAERSWVDQDRKLLVIPSNEFWQPKNGKPRMVPISDSVQKILDHDCTHPTILFPNRKAKHFKKWPKDKFWKILEEANVDGHPHMFRHYVPFGTMSCTMAVS